MAKYLEKKEVKKALEKAKELEKQPEPIPTRQKEVKVYKEMVSLSEQLRKLLKASWFVKDVHKEEKKKALKKKIKKKKKVKRKAVKKKTAKKKKK